MLLRFINSKKDMTNLIGRSGIAATDAMIVNLVLGSKFPLIVTGDEDVAYVVEWLSHRDKSVLVTDVGK